MEHVQVAEHLRLPLSLAVQRGERVLATAERRIQMDQRVVENRIERIETSGNARLMELIAPHAQRLNATNSSARVSTRDVAAPLTGIMTMEMAPPIVSARSAACDRDGERRYKCDPE